MLSIHRRVAKSEQSQVTGSERKVSEKLKNTGKVECLVWQVSLGSLRTNFERGLQFLRSASRGTSAVFASDRHAGGATAGSLRVDYVSFRGGSVEEHLHFLHSGIQLRWFWGVARTPSLCTSLTLLPRCPGARHGAQLFFLGLEATPTTAACGWMRPACGRMINCHFTLVCT